MDNLLQNRLFLQYLSGAGGAMSTGQPVGAALNDITQQNISAQSKAELNKRYMKILQEMMEGKIPSKSKYTVSDMGLDVKIDRSALDNTQQDYVEPGVGNIATGLRAEAGATPQFGQMSTDRSNFLNPSASPLDDISGADLAGLTAADVSQALSGAIGVQSLKQKTLTDIADESFRQKQFESSEAFRVQQMKESEARIEAMSLPKDERTAAVKNFEYAQSMKDGSFKGTFRDWEKDAKTTHQKEYNQAVKEGYEGNFHEWLRDITALGGGLSLEEKITEKEAFADIKSKKYFTDPKGVAADVDKYINTEDVQNKLFALDPAKRDRETVREKEKFIVSKITAAGGKIVGSKVEGRTFVWSVKWPDGKTTEVRYAN